MQQTVKSKVSFTGVGVHTGRATSVTIRPAEAGTGIVFHRIDLVPPVSIEATAAAVVNTRLSTTIGRGGATVSTIEHLVAALRGLGIDNAHIDIDGPEVPIMDGSAAPFVAALLRAGRQTLGRPKKCLVVKKALTVSDGDKEVTVVPARGFSISFALQFNHPAVSSQSLTVKFSEEAFAGEVAPARTFGFLAEVETLKANGLARGGSLENVVVIGEEGVLNPEGLRYADEFVRHKILDTIGDLTLAGMPLIGHVKSRKSGHELNHRFVQELLARRDCWELVEGGERAGRSERLPLAANELAWAKA